MSLRPPPSSRQRGAALLMLVALAGIGSAALLMQAYKPGADDLRQELQTQQILGEAREALLGYAALHGRLPRPATSALDGAEDPQPCDSADSCNGFIPWVTLGIRGYDSWGKLLRYSVTPAFTNTSIRQLTTGDKVVIGRATNGLPTYIVGQAQCELYAQCAPAVLYSSGKYNLGTSVLGIHQASVATTNVDERQNDATPTYFISRARNNNAGVAGGEFDDMVTWVPIQQLQARLRATRSF
jgi:hypothetical protein